VLLAAVEELPVELKGVLLAKAEELPEPEGVIVATKGPICSVPQGLLGAWRQPPRYCPRLPVELVEERTWLGPYAETKDVTFEAKSVELTRAPIRVAWALCSAARRASKKETSGDWV